MSQGVGIVGLGLMGTAFTKNLLEAGFKVQGYDIEPHRMEAFKARGGEPVDSPAATAKGVSHVITSLPTSDIVRQVVLGAGGIAEGATAGLYLVDTTTSRPEDSMRLAVELAEPGLRFLDAAVSGTSAMAMQKDLVIVAGGAQEDFDACRAVFAGFSREAYLMGPVGSGARTKLVINLILAGNRLALAEGLLLGEKVGLDMDRLLGVVQDAACSSKTMFDKGPKMLSADYAPQGQIKTSLKDARLMLEQGQWHGAPMLMTTVWAQILQMAYQKGQAELDTVSFYEVLRDMAGLERRI
jgi:2-hydroxy-3-oxopropionate reductase